MGALCAWIGVGQEENKRMPPDWFWDEVDAGGGTDVAVARGVVGEGTGEG